MRRLLIFVIGGQGKVGVETAESLGYDELSWLSCDG